jgi:3-oxoacyl-[acyl-carrier protein] reductase
MDLGLQGRAAIVTGASRGIGRSIAAALAAEGCRLLLCGRTAEALDATADEITAAGGTAVTCVVDQTAPGAAAKIVAACQSAFGRIDVLVNNAGNTAAKPLDQLTSSDWREGFELNFFAAADLSVACAAVMREAGWGRIVHVASISGREPDPIFAPYSASKAALLNLSTSLSQAYAPAGVLSSCVVPGVVLTELTNEVAEASAVRSGSTADEMVARMLKKHRVAAGRFGQPEEVAAAVVFLASEQAGWITGATLEIDGGTLRSV